MADVYDPTTQSAFGGLAARMHGANLASKTHGKRGFAYDLDVLEYQVSLDSSLVQGYVLPIIEQLKDVGETPSALREYSKIISEAEAISQSEGSMLSERENTSLLRYYAQLRLLIAKYTSLSSQVHSKFDNIVRRGGSTRERVVDSLSSSKSVLGRMIAWSLKSKSGTTSATSGNVKSLRSSILAHAVENTKSPVSAPSLGGEPETSPTDTSTETSTGMGESLAPLLQEQIAVLKSIDETLRGTRQDQQEAVADADEARERGLDDIFPEAKSGSGSSSPLKIGASGAAAGATGGSGAGLTGFFGRIFGVAPEILTGIGSSLLMFGKVIAVITAAFAGWGIGKLLNRFTGASDRLSEILVDICKFLEIGPWNDKKRPKWKQALDVASSPYVKPLLNTLPGGNFLTMARDVDKLTGFTDNLAANQADVAAPAPNSGLQPSTYVPNSNFNSNTPPSLSSVLQPSTYVPGSNFNSNTPPTPKRTPLVSHPTISSNTPMRLTQSMKDILQELEGLGITDPATQYNILAQTARESYGGRQLNEQSYFKTSYEDMIKVPAFKDVSNERSKRYISKKTYESWKQLGPKEFDKNFFDRVYGDNRYIGRGATQLTGLPNYAEYTTLYNKHYGKAAGGVDEDFVKNPERIGTDPNISNKITALFYKYGLAQLIAAREYKAKSAARRSGRSLSASELSAFKDKDPNVVGRDLRNVTNVAAGMGNDPFSRAVQEPHDIALSKFKEVTGTDLSNAIALATNRQGNLAVTTNAHGGSQPMVNAPQNTVVSQNTNNVTNNGSLYPSVPSTLTMLQQMNTVF